MASNSGGFRDSLNECLDEIIHVRISVARRQWREMKSGFQKLQDRDGFEFRVINITAACQRRDDDRGNANTGAPTIASHGRRDVVPAAAVLIVRDDNRAFVPDIAVLHSVDDIRDMLLPSHYVGVPGMFVVDPRKLDK